MLRKLLPLILIAWLTPCAAQVASPTQAMFYVQIPLGASQRDERLRAGLRLVSGERMADIRFGATPINRLSAEETEQAERKINWWIVGGAAVILVGLAAAASSKQENPGMGAFCQRNC